MSFLINIFFGHTFSNEGVHSCVCKMNFKQHVLEEMMALSTKYDVIRYCSLLSFYRLKVAPGLWLLLESLSKSISFLTSPDVEILPVR